MREMPNVAIVVGRCARKRLSFGMRFEEHGSGKWRADWAFALNENSAQREQYATAEIKGAIGFDSAYPGCPHCSSMGMVRCQCGGVLCWDGKTGTFVCPWCTQSGEVRGQLERLSRGGDR